MNLTRRSILAATLIVALGVVGLWSDGQVPEQAWKAALVLLALGLIYEWIVVNRNWPRLALVGDGSLSLGEASSLGLCFSNAGPRRLAVQFVAALPEGLHGSRENREVSVPAASDRVVDVEVRAVSLGSKRWGPIPATVLGPLGLARWSRRLPLHAEVNVRLDTLRAGQRSATSATQGLESRMQIGGGIELHHLRPYRRGDARSAIDWKATARSGELVTRVFGEDQHLEILVAIDAGRTSRIELDGMNQLSHYVNLAARFAEYATIAEDRAGLVVFADRILRSMPPRRGLEGVRQVRGELEGLAPLPVESDLISASLRIRKLVRHRSLVVLLTDLYDRGANNQLARFVRLLLPKHLPVVVGIMSDDVAALASAPAGGWFDPYRSLAAREYLADVESNIARLRRMGAHALTARPRELDGRVFALYDSLRLRHLI